MVNKIKKKNVSFTYTMFVRFCLFVFLSIFLFINQNWQYTLTKSIHANTYRMKTCTFKGNKLSSKENNSDIELFVLFLIMATIKGKKLLLLPPPPSPTPHFTLKVALFEGFR